jgi:membrane protease YdiL (CAAX protease family)
MSWFKRGLDALVHPTIRLKATTEFPLTGATLGLAYVVGFVLFLVGSFAPLLVFFAGMWLIANYPSDFSVWVLDLMFHRSGEPKPFLMGTLMVTSFAGGFSLQMWYLSRLLRRRGHRLLDVVGLSTASLRGRTRLHTAWSILWRALFIFGIAIVVQQLITLFITIPDQPTVEMARKLAGQSGWVFFIIAAIAAPLLEEFVFRGVLFQAMRSTYHQYRGLGSPGAAEGSTGGIRHRLARFLGRTLFKSERACEMAAVVSSAMVFALWHLQFNPLHLFVLFIWGVLLAEIFRRSGTLWTAIAAHALNNGLMALIVILG